MFSGYHVLGVLPIAVGAGFYFWCAWDFAFAGHGTPAPIDPPKALVSRGLYRVVRNPIYVAVLLVLFGESLVFSSGIIFRYNLLVWLFFHLFVVFYEEPTLRKKFARAYEEYCRVVWRWIPRVPRTWRFRVTKGILGKHIATFGGLSLGTAVLRAAAPMRRARLRTDFPISAALNSPARPHCP